MLEPVEDAEKRRVVLRQLQHDGKSSGLSGIEVIDAVVLANEEWTPENVSNASERVDFAALLTPYQGTQDWSAEDQ